MSDQNGVVASILRYWKRNGFGASISINMKYVGHVEACSVMVRSPDAHIGKIMGTGWDEDPVSSLQKAHLEVLQYMERNAMVDAGRPAPEPAAADPDDEPA